MTDQPNQPAQPANETPAPGIQDALKVASTIEDLAKAINEAKADGSVSWLDIPKFAPLVLDVRSIIEAGPELKVELKSLSNEETTQLATALFKSLVDLTGAVTKKPGA